MNYFIYLDRRDSDVPVMDVIICETIDGARIRARTLLTEHDVVAARLFLHDAHVETITA